MNVNISPPDVLSNWDLDDIASELLSHYKGTYSKNELGFKINKKKSMGMIINLMDSNAGGGSHWTAFYYDAKKRLAFYMDSYGVTYPEEIVAFLKLNNIDTVLKNMTRLQADGSTACGYYCLKWLKFMETGKDPVEFLAEFSDFNTNEKIINKWKTEVAGPALVSANRNQKQGSGIFDLPQEYNPVVRKFIEDHADWTITDMLLARKPIEEGHLKLLNLLSFGKLSENKNAMNFDQLFHLSFEMTLQKESERVHIRLEKNHVIQLNILSQLGNGIVDDFKKLSQKIIQFGKKKLQLLIEKASHTDPKILTHMRVEVPPGLLFGEFLDRGLKRVGPKIWFTYDGLKYNCQHFVDNTLIANGMMSLEIKKFVVQSAEKLIRGAEYLKPIMDGITNASAILDHLIYG